MLHTSEVHPPKKAQSDLNSPFIRNPFALLFAAWGTLMVITAFSLVGLVNPDNNAEEGDFWTESRSETVSINNSPVPISPSPEAELEVEVEETENLSEFTALPEPVSVIASESSSGLPLWTFGAIALGCASGSLLVTFALQKATTPPSITNKSKKVKRVAKKPSSQTNKGRKTPSNHPSSSDPQVTILSDEFAHPLDSDEEDLATEMDLRKSQSLSSLLQNW